MRKVLSNLAQSVAELLFPQHCVRCGKENPHQICDACFGEVFVPPDAVCEKCGRLRLSGISGPDCAECHGKTYGFVRARSLYPYEGFGRRLFLAAKFNKEKRTIAYRIASEAMKTRVRGKTAPEFFNLGAKSIDFIVEVPVFRPRRFSMPSLRVDPKGRAESAPKNRRDFNIASVIAYFAAREFRLPRYENALRKTRDIPSQVGLSPTARQDNVKDAYVVGPGFQKLIEKKAILLVDDLLTTGATASECARVLKRAGADRVYVLTLFATAPRPDVHKLWELDSFKDEDLYIPSPIEFE